MTPAAVLAAMMALVSPLAAGLVFENRVVEVPAAPDAEVVEVLFPFRVQGGDVRIESFDAPCSCLSAQISDDGKLDWKEGEKGTVKGIFELGSFKGTVEKYILLNLAGGAGEIRLTARVVIPQLVKLDPPTVSWDLGGDNSPKSIMVTMHHDKPINLTEANVSHPNFQLEIKPLQAGRKYELVVTPREVEARALAMIRLRTDAEFKRHQRYQAFAMVRPALQTGSPTAPR